MTNLSRWTAILVIVLLVAACGDDENQGNKPKADGSGEPTPAEAAPTISDAEFSLLQGSVFDVAVPPVANRNAEMPGENDLVGRMSPTAPPPLPHTIDDYLPIELDENACMECHQAKGDEDGPPLPESHLRDLRRKPGTVGAKAAGARYICTLCHVPTTDAKPLPQAADGE